MEVASDNDVIGSVEEDTKIDESQISRVRSVHVDLSDDHKTDETANASLPVKRTCSRLICVSLLYWSDVCVRTVYW